MKTDWYPKAVKRSWGRDGGSMVGGPPRGVLHETQTVGVPSYNSGGSAPHLTLLRDGTWQQHIPFSRAARALRNLSGGVQTNRQGSVNIQIEVIGYSKPNDWTPAMVSSLREFMAWAEREWGIPNRFPLETGGPEEYGYNNPLELSPTEWVNFTGWCAHQHVPENTHWDVGNEAGVAEVFSTILEEDMFVKYGDTGEMVKFWQWAVGVTADGIYGPATKAAVAAFTSSDGMQVGPREAAQMIFTPNATPVPTPPPDPVRAIPDNPTIMGDPYFTRAETLAWAQRKTLERRSPYNEINIGILVDTYYEEAAHYGVRPDLALCQSAKETGYWTYTGDVGPWQWNFAGIGATGGVRGNSFPTLRDGVKAHLLRLRMYAVNDAAWYDATVLGRSLPSYLWGVAPYVQDLNGRWAVPGTTYGQSIVNDYLRKITQ